MCFLEDWIHSGRNSHFLLFVNTDQEDHKIFMGMAISH